MSLQTNQCCCCGPCDVPVVYCGKCQCVCRWLCVCLDIPNGIYDLDDCDADDCGCEHKCLEVEWDEATESWHGTINCGGRVQMGDADPPEFGHSVSIDFEFYLQEDEYGNCTICLRSYCLGYVSGNEQCVPIQCPTLNASWAISDAQVQDCGGNAYCPGGTLSISCSQKISPQNPPCYTCDCICRCLCFTLVDPDCLDGYGYAGSDVNSEVACFNSSINGWQTTIDCDGADPTTITLTFDNDDYGECVATLHAPNIGVDNMDVTEFITCPDVNISISGTKYNGTQVTLNISCYLCEQGCPPGIPCPACPPDGIMPFAYRVLAPGSTCYPSAPTTCNAGCCYLLQDFMVVRDPIEVCEHQKFIFQNPDTCFGGDPEEAYWSAVLFTEQYGECVKFTLSIWNSTVLEYTGIFIGYGKVCEGTHTLALGGVFPPAAPSGLTNHCDMPSLITITSL